MYDNSQRSMWLEQAYTVICCKFGFDAKNILITASYPPAGARGDLSRVRPADFDTQWRANDNEKDGFLSIHPMSFRSPLDALKAMLWAMGRAHYGFRHGASRVGLYKEPDATLTADAETESKLRDVLAEVGDPPPGFADPFPIRRANRNRQRHYACLCDFTQVHTSKVLDATCNKCSCPFVQV